MTPFDHWRSLGIPPVVSYHAERINIHSGNWPLRSHTKSVLQTPSWMARSSVWTLLAGPSLMFRRGPRFSPRSICCGWIERTFARCHCWNLRNFSNSLFRQNPGPCSMPVTSSPVSAFTRRRATGTWRESWRNPRPPTRAVLQRAADALDEVRGQEVANVCRGRTRASPCRHERKIEGEVVFDRFHVSGK